MARGTRKTLERSGTDRLTSGKLPPCHSFNPSPLLDFAASPFRTTSLPPTQPRRDTHNRLPPPPPTYFQRPTNSFPIQACSNRRTRTGSGFTRCLPILPTPPPSISPEISTEKERKVEIKSGNLSPRDKFNFLFFPNFIYIYVHLKLSCYRMIFEARNRLFWFV